MDKIKEFKKNYNESTILYNEIYLLENKIKNYNEDLNSIREDTIVHTLKLMYTKSGLLDFNIDEELSKKIITVMEQHYLDVILKAKSELIEISKNL